MVITALNNVNYLVYPYYNVLPKQKSIEGNRDKQEKKISELLKFKPNPSSC